MNGAFDVRTSARFDRLLKKLVIRHRHEAGVIFAEALGILETDPYNQPRRRDVKKLD